MLERKSPFHPVPSYGLLDPTIADWLEHFPPTGRAEEAMRIARVLTDGQSRSVSGDQTRLAGLMNSSTSHWVSDRLPMESCTVSTPAMADALRRLYVQAPRSTSRRSPGWQRWPTTPSTATAKHCAR